MPLLFDMDTIDADAVQYGHHREQSTLSLMLFNMDTIDAYAV
jgi:hypothetical protein